MAATSNAKNKRRLDQLLVQRGLAPSRTAATGLIMAGQVRKGEQILLKPGQLVATDIEISITQTPKFVSRGGDKLASVAQELGLSFQNRTVVDVGSSTGGFTDYALQQKAKKVYAIDVGRGQLSYKLRQDPRVVVMERTDIREVKNLPEPIDIAMVDVSFISLTQVLPTVAKLVPTGNIIVLAKPQFEAGRITASKYKGVISDDGVRQKILSSLEQRLKPEFTILKSADSKIAGAQGNVERFYKLEPVSSH